MSAFVVVNGGRWCYLLDSNLSLWCVGELSLALTLPRQLTNKNSEQRMKNTAPLISKTQIPSTEIETKWSDYIKSPVMSDCFSSYLMGLFAHYGANFKFSRNPGQRKRMTPLRIGDSEYYFQLALFRVLYEGMSSLRWKLKNGGFMLVFAWNLALSLVQRPLGRGAVPSDAWSGGNVSLNGAMFLLLDLL